MSIQTPISGDAATRAHPETLYEKRVDALVMLLARSVGELNPAADDAARPLPPRIEDDPLPYYDRWLVTLRDNLTGAGVLAPEEIEEKLAALRGREGEEE